MPAVSVRRMDEPSDTSDARGLQARSASASLRERPPSGPTTTAMRALGDELRASERARRAGTVELALVEEGGVAMTESYFEVPAPAGAAPGALVEVTL